jgi:DnaJ-class molecular chaperone
MERDLIKSCNLLGVNPDASPKRLKTAFRDLARSLHPDLNPDRPGSLDRFIQIRKAYEILIARAVRENREEASQAEIPWRLTGIEKNGLDILYHLEIDPAEALTGGRLTLPLRCWERCPECGGKGHAISWSWARLTPTHLSCERCGSRGIIRRVGRLEVRLPRLFNPGTSFKVDGKGDQTRYGGPKGDLLLNIRFTPDPHPRGLAGGLDRGLAGGLAGGLEE